MPSDFPFISCQSYNSSEEIKLIEYVSSKNNSYLLMDRAYKDGKTIFLTKAHSFHAVLPPKKNLKSPWLYDKQLYK